MDEANSWLAQKLASNNQKDTIIAEYERLVNAAKLDAYLATMQKLVGATGLDLIPSPYPLISKGEWSWPKRRLLGILVSAALLSLGAPFWYNALKSLTNLRPTLANAVEKNPKQSGSPPSK